MVTNDTLVQLARQSLPGDFQNLSPDDLLILADVRQGGALLAEYLPDLADIAGLNPKP